MLKSVLSQQSKKKSKTKQRPLPESEYPYFEDSDLRSERLERIWALIHLTVRFIYTFVAWAVLAKGINSTSFFVSLFLFIVPVFMDCIQFGFAGWSRRWVVIVEFVVCLAWLLFALFGLAGIFIVSLDEGVYIVTTASDFIGFQIPSFPIQWIWFMLASLPFITGIDFACRYSVKKKKEGKGHVE